MLSLIKSCLKTAFWWLKLSRKHFALQSSEARLATDIRRPCCSEVHQEILASLMCNEVKLVTSSTKVHEHALRIRKDPLPVPRKA